MTTRKLHRTLGPLTAMFLLWLIATGLLLNHGDELKLDQRALPDGLLFLLDTAPPERQRHWHLGQATLSDIEGRLYWDARPLGNLQVRQVAPFAYGWLVLGEQRLRLVDDDGLEIATLPLPAPRVELAGIQPVQLRHGQACWQLDEALSGWTPCVGASEPPAWIKAQAGAAPGALRQWKIDHQLTWETLIHRLHSGRILGAAGPWLLDGMALLLGMMALSGLRLRQARRPRASGA